MRETGSLPSERQGRQVAGSAGWHEDTNRSSLATAELAEPPTQFKPKAASGKPAAPTLPPGKPPVCSLPGT